MFLSIVTTLYRSTAYIDEFHRRASAEAAKITSDYEIIYVNDGCPENSLAAALKLQECDSHVRVLDLSRNFGQHKAIMTGLEYARGELTFLLDVDLEEEPELLRLFYRELREQDADVAYGVQLVRQGSWFKRTSGRLFYRLFDLLSNFSVPANPLNARLMTRRYVTSLLMHKERELYLAGLWAITGYKQVPVPVIKHCRGTSSYTFLRRLTVSLNAVLSFSNRPLIGIFLLGLLISSVSMTAAAWLIVRRIFFDEILAGWSSLIVSVWLLGGMTICCLGVMSLYLSRIFVETKQRPYTVVRHEYAAETAVLSAPKCGGSVVRNAA